MPRLGYFTRYSHAVREDPFTNGLRKSLDWVSWFVGGSLLRLLHTLIINRFEVGEMFIINGLVRDFRELSCFKVAGLPLIQTSTDLKKIIGCSVVIQTTRHNVPQCRVKQASSSGRD